jgi:D-threo-aldose 1-dehydrogenase
MPRTVTVAAGLETSALGFGCAGLFREPSRNKRLRLFETAYELGIRHFDIAPMYGLGIAERELGRMVRGRRESVVIATKFGIEPTLVARQLARIQGPIRRLLRAVPALRQQLITSAAGPGSGPAGGLLYSSPGYDGASARASLESSLGAIGTDYVDLLLLHDPNPGSVRSDDVYAYLEDACRAGDIRTWGIAGEPVPTMEVARHLPGLVPVLQLRDDVFLRSLRSLQSTRASGLITFGALGRALSQIVTYVTADPKRYRRWSAAIGADCGKPSIIAPLLLRDAFRENAHGTVLFSTVHAEHIRTAATAADAEPDRHDGELDAFRELIEAESKDAYATTKGRA